MYSHVIFCEAYQFRSTLQTAEVRFLIEHIRRYQNKSAILGSCRNVTLHDGIRKKFLLVVFIRKTMLD